jgi:hypothetical protein
LVNADTYQPSLLFRTPIVLWSSFGSSYRIFFPMTVGEGARKVISAAISGRLYKGSTHSRVIIFGIHIWCVKYKYIRRISSSIGTPRDINTKPFKANVRNQCRDFDKCYSIPGWLSCLDQSTDGKVHIQEAQVDHKKSSAVLHTHLRELVNRVASGENLDWSPSRGPMMKLISWERVIRLRHEIDQSNWHQVSEAKSGRKSVEDQADVEMVQGLFNDFTTSEFGIRAAREPSHQSQRKDTRSCLSSQIGSRSPRTSSASFSERQRPTSNHMSNIAKLRWGSIWWK